MSCRHSLANGTCTVCYPATGTYVPDGPGDSMDGPGAVPATPEETIAKLELRIALEYAHRTGQCPPHAGDTDG